MTRKDWVLLSIASAATAISPVQLQKCLFLLGENMRKAVGKDFYEFKPYNYGPFDVEVYQDAETLAAEGLVEIRPVSGRSRTYRVTPAGLARAAELRSMAPTDALQYLEKVVAWAQSLSFQDLVRSIYKKYPEYRANSVFQS